MSKAPLLIASLVMGAGAAALEHDGRRRHMKAQEKANDAWLAYQNRATKRAELDERESRDAAWNSLEEFVDANSQENREASIEEGAKQLEKDFERVVDVNSLGEDVRNSGQQEGRSGEFDTALATSLNKASGDVRRRLKNLARVSAYGAPGMGGMIRDSLTKNSRDISFLNDDRRQNLGVLQTARKVQPEIMEYKQSPWVPLLQIGSTVAGLGAAGGLGTGGSSIVEAATQGGGPGMTFGNTKALSGLSGAELIPGAATDKTFSFLGPLNQVPIPWNKNVVQF